MQPHERVEAVRTAMRGLSVDVRGKRSLTIDMGPNPVTDGDGEIVGIEVWVTLREDGTIVPIDPHRVIVNPPNKHKGHTDPEAALWAVLWDGVEAHPGQAPTAVFRKAQS